MNPKNQNQHQDQNRGLFYKAQVRWLFHSHIKIKIPIFCDDALFDEFFQILIDVDKQYNSYSESSFISLINKHAGSFVDVDQETIQILKQIVSLSEFFDGEYDITVMPLIRLWGFYKNDKHRIPDLADIENIKRKIDFRKIEILDNRVRIGEGQEIITGSFIKAYAVDKLIERMKQYGITDSIVNAGGSTVVALNNTIHPYWQIDVTNPDKKDETLLKLNVQNSCFSTSSQSNTFLSIDGQKYGHILNPQTGFPSANKQIGIITNSAFLGDIVSTGLFCQSLEGFARKMKMLSKIFPIAGFLMDRDGIIQFSEDFETYVLN